MSLLLIPLALAGWQALAMSGAVSPLLVPGLDAIAVALWRDLIHGTLSYQLLFSLGLVGAGTILGAFFAVILAAIASLGREALRSVRLLTALLHPLPGIALLPLVVLWAGTGTPAVLLVMIHAALWPVYLNLQTGLDEIPQRYREMTRNWELRRAGIFMHVIVPAVFPSMLSGLRTAWARSWRALIAAEMVFGAAGHFGGIGWYLFERRVYMDTPGLYAGLFMVMAAGVLMDALLFGSLERITARRWGRDTR
ncbi:MAG TPA: ABC transporter permease [bacterium]|nr:ABC transporter permease [bacterium]